MFTSFLFAFALNFGGFAKPAFTEFTFPTKFETSTFGAFASSGRFAFFSFGKPDSKFGFEESKDTFKLQVGKDGSTSAAE